MTLGRGAWSRVGMPAGAGVYYELKSPVMVGTLVQSSDPIVALNSRAVNYGVKALQNRCNSLIVAGSGLEKLVVDGVFGPYTSSLTKSIQQQFHLEVDGIAGPKTMKAIFWHAVKKIGTENLHVSFEIQHSVGGIAQHESGFDPGAVNPVLVEDLGLVQINGPANPNMTEAQRFDYGAAFTYALNRINSAYQTYQKIEPAIGSYYSPLWAKQWANTGHAPNQAIKDFVDFVLAWVPPF